MYPVIEKALTPMLSSGYPPLDTVDKWRREYQLCFLTVWKELHEARSLIVNQKRKCLNIIELLTCLKALFPRKVSIISNHVKSCEFSVFEHSLRKQFCRINKNIFLVFS